MEVKTYNKKSLHYRLATVYGPLDDWEVRRFGTNICEYIQAILTGLFVCCAIIAAALVVGYCILSSLFAVYFSYIAGTWIGDAFSNVSILFVGCLSGVIVVYYVFTYTLNQTSRIPTPNVIGTAYSSWKEKTCVFMKFE